MSFYKYKEVNGKLTPIKTKKVVLDTSNDEILTEQSHVKEVDINNIVKRHGIDMIQKTAMLQGINYQFDDVSGNDFQEAMQKVAKAQQTFDQLPSGIRDKFDHNPAKFLDFIQNPDNGQALVDMGLAQPIPEAQPVQVEVVSQPESNPETPPT